MSADFHRVDEIFSAFVDAGQAPGVAYGVVSEGRLLHAGGAGVTDLGRSTRPDERSVFRIASLTKSFTAAAVLRLRDSDALRLDDLVADYVPELTAAPRPTADAPPLTIRHLLTMSGGLPTDDAWADRQESMTEQDFAAFLAGGIGFVSAPGTAFDYSNLGFALLGRVVTRVARREYRDEVRTALLQPLGLDDTVFVEEDVDPDRLVCGHRRTPDGWVPVPFDRPGVFSAIGGLYSTVADLARWAAGFADAFPPRDDPEHHPLSRASRREMQQQHRAIPAIPVSAGAAAARPRPLGYGFGLFVEEHPLAGTVVSHPGGYPGFGAHMRWSSELGIGVIALANGRYAPATTPATEALEMVLSGRSCPPSEPWAETVQACMDVERLLARWDDALADRIFADNVDLDLPREDRRREFEAAAAAIGPVTAPVTGPVTAHEAGRDAGKDASPAGRPPAAHPTPASASWQVRGAHASVHIDLQLTPQRPPRVQSVVLRPAASGG